MATVLTEKAKEKGTYVVNVAFLDEDAAAVVPTAATWSLRTGDNTEVNSRTDIALTPATAVDIVMSGLDLEILRGLPEGERRYLVVEWTYNSTLGAGLPGKEEIVFDIENLHKVT